MSIEIVSNRNMFGKIIKNAPYKAVLAGEILATGKLKNEVKAAAMTVLRDAYGNRGLLHTYVRVAKDRTIYVGKVTGVGLMEIYTFKPIANGATRCGSSMMGEYKGRMEDYLKTVVDDYDRATIILHDDFDKVLRERPTVCVHGMALEHRCFECEQLGTK